MMKKRLLPLALALAMLAACGAPDSTATDAAASAADTQTTAAQDTAAQDAAAPDTATPEPTAADPLAAFTPTGAAPLPYDEIMPVWSESDWPEFTMQGYYTMCQDGKWGLMRSDGTVLLDCAYEVPFYDCGLGHWCSGPTDYEEALAVSEKLTAMGAGEICFGHGGSRTYHFYDTENGVTYSAYQSAGPSVEEAILPGEEDAWGGWMPCCCATKILDDDMEYYDPDINRMVFAKADGTLLNPLDQCAYTRVGAFVDEPIAPVEIDGKWAYIDKSGTLVTEAVYSSIYGYSSPYNIQGDDMPAWAENLKNGYAAVCRDGQWGLLDATGAEVLPCSYGGAVWNGSELWLKQADGWQQYTPAAPQVSNDIFADVPENIVRPVYDFKPTGYRQRQSIPDSALNMRAGPGTDYDKVGSLPPSTIVTVLGRTDDWAWLFTEYEGQYGWVSTDYLRWI